MSATFGAITGDLILVEDGLQLISQLAQAIQQARANGSSTIDASVLKVNRDARDAALTKLDSDLAAGE